ncbi:hypothetical protein [Shewanella halifaxensis]|uniref:hypothetical protein n=1 Tax=Shewanella halifaxensis TaxID=271098 RepID=UPI000D597488|nr:hypothetical protein [Shewanella halifaxensis]
MTSICSAANQNNMTAGANISPKTKDLSAQQTTSSSATTLVDNQSASKPLPNTGDSISVTLSTAAQDKLAAEQAAAKTPASTAKTEQTAEVAEADKLAKADKVDASADNSDDEEGNDIESFLFDTLGLDKPEDIDENGEASYSVRQYVKAAATVGSMIAMLI